jgi:hypothetical protein
VKFISFDAISIEAIRAGKKTMTRRPVKGYEFYYVMQGDNASNFVNVRMKRPITRWRVGDEAYVKTGWTDATGKKHPAMFMKRVDSPFSIRITAHRVERLQDISAGDVVAEGVEITHNYQYDFWWRWDSIYKHVLGKRWEDNPLVEVLTFEVVS